MKYIVDYVVEPHFNKVAFTAHKEFTDKEKAELFIERMKMIKKPTVTYSNFKLRTIE